MNNRYSNFLLIAVGLFLSCSLGCTGGSSNVGQVTGVVTLEGKPLVGAEVIFYPANGRASVGTTDDTGKYELAYIRNENGAVVGEHRVTISTEVLPKSEYEIELDERDEGDGGDEVETEEQRRLNSRGQREGLPPKFSDRKKTELTATVKAGPNEIDFPLKKK